MPNKDFHVSVSATIWCVTQEQELELIEKAQRDSSEDAPAADAAFTALYEFYLPRIYGYIYKRVGRRETAEDLTSQTFLKMVENLKRFKGQYFKAWIYRIATNTVIDYYRTHKSEMPMEEGRDLPSREVGPVEEAEKKENREKVLAVLALLPEKHQRVLYLKFFADFCNNEMALSSEITENALGVRLHRALKAFQTIYNSFRK